MTHVCTIKEPIHVERLWNDSGGGASIHGGCIIVYLEQPVLAFASPIMVPAHVILGKSCLQINFITLKDMFLKKKLS